MVGESLSVLVIPTPTGGKTTITEFIEGSSKLISVLGVFFALSVFANNLPDKATGRFLSFLLFTLAIMLFIELLRNFAEFDWHGKIFWFREVLTLSALVFVYIYAKTYYPFLLGFVGMMVMVLAFVIVFVLFQVVIRLVLKMSWFRKLNPRARSIFIPAFGAIFLMIVCEYLFTHFHHRP